MFKLGATNPFSQALADMRKFDKQVSFGMIVGLTRTVVDVKTAQIAEIDRVIDKPTAYTRNSIYVQKATPSKPEAAAGLKSDEYNPAPGHQPTNYLRPQIDGGQRRQKGFESLLSLAGLSPSGWLAVPGKAAKLDAHGNVSRGQVIQILSQLRLQLTAGYTRNLPVGGDKATLAKRRRAIVRAGGRYFVLKQGEAKKVPPGIYQRQVLGKRTFGPAKPFPEAVFVFVRRATYRRRFDWEAVAERTVSAKLEANIDAGIAYAQQTAR